MSRRLFRAAALATVVAALLALPSSAIAQDREQPSWVKDVLKRVVLDPTTYAPAVIAYDATMRDWNSSQPFFKAGFVEQNDRFTVSGFSNDAPVDYGTGKRRILADAFGNLPMSIVNNVGVAVFDRALTRRFPEKRRLVRVLGWAERIAVATYLAHDLAGRHYSQWRENERLASQLGLP